jgi:hypothetical protein
VTSAEFGGSLADILQHRPNANRSATAGRQAVCP